MNVIYKYVNLTRLERDDPPFYYIGSKTECTLHRPYLKEDRFYLYENKMGRCYFGSPSNGSYWDHWKTDKFTVEIISEVGDRDNIRVIESEYLEDVNARDNPEYYNMTNNTLAVKGGCVNKDYVVNIYGEKYAEYAQRMSNRSKRDSRAIKLGFRNFGELCLFIKNKVDEGLNYKQVTDILGVKNRHFARVTSSPYDLDKMKLEIATYKDNESMVDTIREHITLGASINAISEILNLEIPTVRYLLGEYWFGETGTRITSKLFRKTQLEIELDITRRWLDGENVKEIHKDYKGMSDMSVTRYLNDCLRRNLKGVELI